MSRKFQNLKTKVLPIEMALFFASIFLLEPLSTGTHGAYERPPQTGNGVQSRNQEHFEIAFDFLGSVQMYPFINRPPRRLKLSPCIWKMRASRVLGLTRPNTFTHTKLGDHSGFPVCRHSGWIGSSNRDKGFYFTEWCSTIVAAARPGTTFIKGVVACWIDHDQSPALGPSQSLMFGRGIPHCGSDGGTYTIFLRQVAVAYNLWNAHWIRTLDEVDDLINVYVRPLVSVL